MVNVGLFLPEQWVKDKKRCQKAGIPQQAQVYKSKWELALDMIDEMEGVVGYDWVNADAFYGNARGFRLGLNKHGKLFILDIHQDQNVYLTHPDPYLPFWSGIGRKPTKCISEQKPVKVNQLLNQVK